MTSISTDILEMVNALPEKEQSLAYEFVKRLVLAWDPFYEKLTPDERERLDAAETEIAMGEYVRL